MRSRNGGHLIVGLDGDRVTLTSGTVRRRAFRLTANRRVEAPASGDDLVRLVNETLAASRPRPESVHVLLGGSDVTRFRMDLPHLKAREREIVLTRRARQEAGLPVEGRLRIGMLRGARAERGQTTWHVAGFPNAALARVAALLDDPLLHVETVSIQEDAALLALPDDLPSHAVILDRNQRGVRITYLVNGTPAHERQVLLSLDGEGERPRQLDRLRFELARTLDYFAGEGSPPPAGIAATPALGLSPEEAGGVAGDLPVFALDLPALPETESGVELAPLGVFRMLVGRGRLPMLDHGRPARSRAKRRAAFALTAAALAAAFGLRAALSYASVQADAVAQLTPTRIALEDEARDLRVALTPVADDTVEEKRLKMVLGMRRPASRLFADVLAAAPEAIVLRDVQFDEGERILVRGETRGDTRLARVSAVAAFRAALAKLPYLSELEDHLTYPTSRDADEAMRFAIHAIWREAP